MQIATGEYGESIMSIKNVTSMDKIQQPIIKDNSKTIAQTIEESGLNSLEENPPSDDLYLAIQKSVALSSGRDEAWRKIAVSDITKVLNEKNVSGADEFAKSAFFPKKQKLSRNWQKRGEERSRI